MSFIMKKSAYNVLHITHTKNYTTEKNVNYYDTYTIYYNLVQLIDFNIKYDIIII